MKYCIILLISASIVSCISQEDRETKALMAAVFENELASGQEIFLFEDAETDWKIPWLDSCTVEGIWNLESDFSQKILIKDVFSHEETERICAEGSAHYKFRKELLPDGINLSSERSRYDSIINAFYMHVGKPEIVELDVALRGYRTYRSFSKPIFFREFTYACLYQSYEGPHLAVFRKEHGKWKRYFSVTFLLV